MRDLYKNFALYYKGLAEKRNHFDLQTEIINELFHELKIQQGNKILDASCGTGAVGNKLFNSGFANIFLTDGSEEMIKLARGNINAHIPIETIKWEYLDSFFERNHNFDSVLILGNSLAHTSFSSLNQIFTSIYQGLKKEGYFIFDLREWVIDGEGNYIQKGKPAGKIDDLGTITVKGAEFSVSSEIKYDFSNKIQAVSYFMKNTLSNKIDHKVTLEYNIFSLKDILPILAGVGFKDDNIQIKSHVNWSYQIICCNK